MLQTTTMAVIAGAAVLLLLGLIALRWKRRRRHSRYADLPALLYFAGDVGSPNVSRRMEVVGDRPAGWPLARPAVDRAARARTAVAWAPAPDETVQLLPGGLRPEIGGEEIRFVARGGERRFTLGRGRGGAHEHIRLGAPTVSRMHAWMEFSDGEWRVGRLSQTNDVIVNGAPLERDAAQLLRDGDRLELGDVAFTFHHPGQRDEMRDVAE